VAVTVSETHQIARYEACQHCADGSCGRCGPASDDHAAPGVVRVVRTIRFIRCPKCEGGTKAYGRFASGVVGLGEIPRQWEHNGCVDCGPRAHPACAPGTAVETVEERVAKQWVPSMHLARRSSTPTTSAACGAPHVPPEQVTTDAALVTCKRIGCKRG
jgi:hypothetical protein